MFCSNIKLYIADNLNNFFFCTEFIFSNLVNLISFLEVLVEVSELYVYLVIILVLVVNQVSLKSLILVNYFTNNLKMTDVKPSLSSTNLYLVSIVSKYVQSSKLNNSLA